MSRSRLIITMIVIILGVLLVPFEQTVAPEWAVRTQDEHGNPLSGVTVREVWQQYSIEQASHEEDKVTGISGEVRFPRRTLRSSLLSRFFGILRNASETGVHASFGPHAYLVAFGKGLGTRGWEDMKESTAQGSATQHSTLVLRKCPPGSHGIECMMEE